jgi:4-amino-4-deoxy-L-arabinose transferase-like glycosyltransferase
VVLFAVSLLWAVITPGFRSADEPAHLNSVIRVADGGGWPRPGTVRYEDEVREAEALAGRVHDGRGTVFPRTTSAHPGPSAFPDLTPTPPGDRASLHELDDGPDPGGPIDQMTQHPPGYYAVAAAVYRLAGAADWRYDRALLLLRALTALTVAAVLPVCCFVAARELTGSERIGALAAVVPLFVPHLHYVSGSVTNDGATVAATAAIWALLLRVLCAGPTRGRLLLLALAVAASCWTKGTALTVLPAVVVAIAIGCRRLCGPQLRAWARPALAATAGVLAVGCALGGWWWVVNLVRYGRVQPPGYLPSPSDIGLLGPVDFLAVFVRRIRWNFFLEVGGRESPDLALLTLVLALAIPVCALVGLFAVRRAGDRAVLLIGAVSTAGAVLLAAYALHLGGRGLPGIQGRYLYVLLVPLAALVAVGVERLWSITRFPARWLPPAGAATGLAVALLGAALGLLVLYGRTSDGWGDAVRRFVGWAAVSPGVVVTLVAVLLLGGLALGVVAGRGDAEEHADERQSDGNLQVHVTETARHT